MGDIVVSNLVVENRLCFLFEKCRRLLLLSMFLARSTLHKYSRRAASRVAVS